MFSSFVIFSSVVERKISSNLKFIGKRKTTNETNDISNSKLTICLKENLYDVDLIPLTDGVTFIKCSSSCMIWSIWLSLAQCPPNLKLFRINIVLGSLFVSVELPVFDSFRSYIKFEALERPVVRSSLGATAETRYKIILLVADQIDKSLFLSSYQHNDHFRYCKTRGTTIDHHHCYNLYNQDFRVQEPTFRETCTKFAENIKIVVQSSANVVEVKCRKAFSDIIPDSTLSACIEYMHIVLIGEYQLLLEIHIRLVTERGLLETLNLHVNKNCTSI